MAAGMAPYGPTMPFMGASNPMLGSMAYGNNFGAINPAMAYGPYTPPAPGTAYRGAPAGTRPYVGPHFVDPNSDSSGSGAYPVAVHDPMLVPVHGMDGLSPVAVAQNLARDQLARGKTPAWMPRATSPYDPLAFSKTAPGMLHMSTHGPGVWTDTPMGAARFARSRDQKLVPVRLPNGMTMQVPPDELAHMPNAVPIGGAGYPTDPSTTGMDLDGDGIPDDGSDPFSARVNAATARINMQEAQVSQYADLGQHSMELRERQSQMLTNRLNQIQGSLMATQHALQMQREWVEAAARRKAALEVDKHRVQVEGQLAQTTMAYKQVRQQDMRLKQQAMQLDASLHALMQQAYAMRGVIRSDSNVIKKLITGTTNSGSGPSGPNGPTAEQAAEAKLQKNERAALGLMDKAVAAREKSDLAADQAESGFMAQMNAGAQAAPPAPGASGAAAGAAAGGAPPA